MNRRLLVLYPREWRERYGPEVASLADELISAGETTPLRAAADLISGAVVERWRVLASRGVLMLTAAAITAAGGVALAVRHAPPGAGAATPYFDAHPVGLLLLIAELGWLLMEAAEFWRGRRSRHWRARATRTDQRGFPIVVGVCVATGTALTYLGPLMIPAAAIRPGAAAFTAGLVMLVAGTGLRGWSFSALRGRYFNFSVMVSPDQPVITTGPYRLLRHPGHAGMLLICVGFGLMSANWAALAEVLLPLAVIVSRIRVEENALLITLGDRYRCYASDHKRLVPLIW